VNDRRRLFNGFALPAELRITTTIIEDGTASRRRRFHPIVPGGNRGPPPFLCYH
jgi:hypothetical protein